jgi:hypothetical protein
VADVERPVGVGKRRRHEQRAGRSGGHAGFRRGRWAENRKF